MSNGGIGILKQLADTLQKDCKKKGLEAKADEISQLIDSDVMDNLPFDEAKKMLMDTWRHGVQG